MAEPGDYVFFVEPAPYWEAAEGKKWIIHYTKVVVDVLAPSRAGTLWSGYRWRSSRWCGHSGCGRATRSAGLSSTTGSRFLATVEVAYYNEGNRVKMPNDAFATQVVKADAHGVFAYSMPRAGWWGFAALVDGAGNSKTPPANRPTWNLAG